MIDRPAAIRYFTAGQTLTLNGKQGGRDIPPQTFDRDPHEHRRATCRTFFNNALGIDTTVRHRHARAGHRSISPATAAGQRRLSVTGNLGTDNALVAHRRGFADAGGNSPLHFSTAPTPPASERPRRRKRPHELRDGYDSLGTPVNVDVTAVLETKADTGNTWRFLRHQRRRHRSDQSRRNAGRHRHAHVRHHRQAA